MNKDHGNRKYQIDHDYFESIDTEDKAYFLGFLVGDGNVDKYGRVRINIHEKDKEVIENFIQYTKSNYPIHKEKDHSTIKIYSKKMCEDLYGLGMEPNKSKHEKFPNIDSYLVPHMIRGMVDADGCLFWNRQRERSPIPKLHFCGSEEVVSNFRNYCSFVTGIDNLNYSKMGSIYQMQIYGYKAAYITRSLYEDAKVFLTRKYNLHTEFVNWSNRIK